MLYRRNKIKEASAKVDNVPGQGDVEQVEVSGNGIVVETAESPTKKKARTGRVGSMRAHSTGVFMQVKEKTVEATTSLNERMAESFWHKDFDFQR